MPVLCMCMCFRNIEKQPSRTYNIFAPRKSHFLEYPPLTPLSCWTGIYPAFANSVDPDLKKPTDLDLHCLPLSMWIYINNLDQVIWLAEN